MKRAVCAIVGMIAVVVSAAVIGLTSCADVPLVGDGAVRLSVQPTTTVAADALHVEPMSLTVQPGAIALTTTPTVTVEDGAVQVTVEIPIDKLGPSLERAASLASDNLGSGLHQVAADAARNAHEDTRALLQPVWVAAIALAVLCLASAAQHLRKSN